MSKKQINQLVILIKKLDHFLTKKSLVNKFSSIISSEVNLDRTILITAALSNLFGLFGSKFDSQADKNYSCYSPSNVYQASFGMHNNRSISC